MKICFMTYSLFSHGGVQRVISTLCNELANTYEVEILYLGELEYSKEGLYNLNEEKINIIQEKLNYSPSKVAIRKAANAINKYSAVFSSHLGTRVYQNLIYPKQSTQHIVELINDNQYDIVIGVAGEINLVLGSIANKINAKTVGWQHNSFDAYYQTKGKYLWRKQKLSDYSLKKLDKVIVLTDEDKKKYRNEMNLNVTRIYNPLSFKSTKKASCHNHLMISVGRLTKQKGFDLLIKAFKQFSDHDNNWKLVIIGDGEDRKKLINMIEEYDLSKRIEIKKFTENILNEYLEASLYVSSARWEGFGLVITEAMECGLPIVSFDTTGPSEIINEVNGVLVAKEDVDQLSKVLLETVSDQERLSALSKQSIFRASEFRVEVIVGEWKTALESL